MSEVAMHRVGTAPAISCALVPTSMPRIYEFVAEYGGRIGNASVYPNGQAGSAATPWASFHLRPYEGGGDFSYDIRSSDLEHLGTLISERVHGQLQYVARNKSSAPFATLIPIPGTDIQLPIRMHLVSNPCSCRLVRPGGADFGSITRELIEIRRGFLTKWGGVAHRLRASDADLSFEQAAVFSASLVVLATALGDPRVEATRWRHW